MSKKTGFTLIELMVVIAIIAILASAGIVSYQVVFKNSRDAKRISDLRVIQTALEQYFADQFYYPTTLSSAGTNFTSTTGNQASPLPSPVKIYINQTPADSIPAPHLQYVYQAIPDTPCDNSNGSTNKCSSYCLYASMENTSNSAVAPCSFTTGPGTGYNYVLTPP